MKSDMRNEIKAYIVRQGMTMQEVVDVLHRFAGVDLLLDDAHLQFLFG